MLWTRRTPTAWRIGGTLILVAAVLMLCQSLADAGPWPQQRRPQPPSPGVGNQAPPPNAVPPKRPARPPVAAKQGDKRDEPVEISGSQLETRDRVALSATFYPGTEGKESVPVLLLHNWKSSREEFALVAEELQKKGCAVLVPDLRGHGESTTQLTLGRGRVREEKLDATKFRNKDFANIAALDMAALRGFLVKKNNDGELNLNKLVIVGSELGAAVAMIWSAYDWNMPNYEHAGIKQGQDVKALVLVSPKWSYTGLDTSNIVNTKVLSPVRDRLSIMILAGSGDPRRLRDVERLHDKFVLNRPQPEELTERSVLYFPFDTTLQAEGLLMYPELKLSVYICQFVEDRVINGEPDAVWMKHR